jgi:hypothetical protein
MSAGAPTPPCAMRRLILEDVRFAFKLLWKQKAFTAAALATLALCIGASTAISRAMTV